MKSRPVRLVGVSDEVQQVRYHHHKHVNSFCFHACFT